MKNKILFAVLPPVLFVFITIALSPPGKAQIAGHIIVSQIQISGGTGKTDNDFIELYNPASQPIDISGWKLRKRAQTGTETSIRVLGEGKIIPAFGFFLWANSKDSFAQNLNADESSTATLAANNSIAFFDKESNLIDALAWGSGHVNPFSEGEAAPGPEGGGSLERKPGDGQGNGWDTDNNAGDFILREISSPHNSQSPPEWLIESTPVPTLTPTPTPTPTSTPVPTPIVTPTLTPTTTPTLTPSPSLLPTPSPTRTPASTITRTPTSTPTKTPAPAAAPKPTVTAIVLPTPTPAPTVIAAVVSTPAPEAKPAPEVESQKSPRGSTSGTPISTAREPQTLALAKQTGGGTNDDILYYWLLLLPAIIGLLAYYFHIRRRM
ncbi:MAG: lamin tail domain-containing protein [Patescibacteria group bacterium]